MSTYILLIIGLIIIALMILLPRLLLMAAVGADAESKGLAGKGGWMALTFFFPAAAIVYACICHWLPVGVTQHCNHCDSEVSPGKVTCPSCRSGRLSPVTGTTKEKARRTVKRCLIAAVITWLLSLMLLSVWTVCYVPYAMGYDSLEEFGDMLDNGYYSSIYDDDDYGDEYWGDEYDFDFDADDDYVYDYDDVYDFF